MTPESFATEFNSLSLPERRIVFRYLWDAAYNARHMDADIARLHLKLRAHDIERVRFWLIDAWVTWAGITSEHTPQTCAAWLALQGCDVEGLLTP